MGDKEILEQGRAAVRRQAWSEAFSCLGQADAERALSPEDLEQLIIAAHLTGRDAECIDLWIRLHHAYLTDGMVDRAVRCAFWLGLSLTRKGEGARAGGWLTRGRRLLEEHDLECVADGYLLIPRAIERVYGGEAEKGAEIFSRAERIGERFGDRNLVVYARHGRGRALIRMGRIDEGVALLDEAMAAVEAGDVTPLLVGDVYCSVIEACQEIYDLRRAREWTAALSHWCDAQPDLVPYRGQCQVRRAEILQLHGAWPDALREANRACASLTRPTGVSAAGLAFYQKAELHRVLGDLDEAEQAYREAEKWSRRPRPGLALLRLAQGDSGAAEATIVRVLEHASDRTARSEILPAFVEIMLSRGNTAAARKAAGELREIANEIDASYLHAVTAGAEGAILLAEGMPQQALVSLRSAWTEFTHLDAPYEAARVRVLLGLACRASGDDEGAESDLSSARDTFSELGARPDVARVDALLARRIDEASHGLSPRELEVLRLVAAGASNRSIAESLFISERTVERHLSNMFAKLDVSSRTAAAAFAFEHGLT